MAPIMSLLYFVLSSPILLTLGGALNYNGCSTSGIEMPTLPNPLTTPPIGTELSFVGIGFGTQNYTCESTGTYKSVLSTSKTWEFLSYWLQNHKTRNVGALAELFDISCLGKTPLFDTIPDIAIAAWNAAPPSITAADVISKLQPLKHSIVLGG